MFVYVSEMICVRRVVVGHEDGFAADPHVPFEALEDRLGQMGGVPTGDRFAESLPQLRDEGLGDQGEGHVAVSNVEVEGSGPVPAQSVKRQLPVPVDDNYSSRERDIISRIPLSFGFFFFL